MPWAEDGHGSGGHGGPGVLRSASPAPPRKGFPPLTPPLPPLQAALGWTRGSWTMQSPVRGLRTPCPQSHVKAPRGLVPAPKALSSSKAHLCSFKPREDVGRTTDSSHERRAPVDEETNLCFSFTAFLFEDSKTSPCGTRPGGSAWGDVPNASFIPWAPGGLRTALLPPQACTSVLQEGEGSHLWPTASSSREHSFGDSTVLLLE